MKKFFIALCAFVLLLPTALGLVACGPKDDLTATQRARNIYALSAVVGANYLGGQESSTQATTLSSAQEQQRPSGIGDNVIDELKTGLQMFDELLETGKIETTIETHQDAKYVDYAFKMTTKMPISHDTFVIYFNEYQKDGTDYSSEAITDPDQEIEFSTKLVGVVVVGEKEYTMTGKREFEAEEGETESEIELKIMTDDNNYVELSQEIEVEGTETETEYKYKVVKDGEEVSEFEVEFENENGQLELELEISMIDGKAVETKNKYKIKPSSKNGEDFVVTYKQKVDDETTTKVTIKVAKTGTGYTFTYSNGATETV